MIAYKCLEPGAVGPFTGFVWPTPGPAGPGSWVTAPKGRPSGWVHACRPGDLPYWLCEELWRVELDGPTAEAPNQITATRARLIERVSGWTRATALAMAEEAIERLRAASSALFEAHGLPGEAAGFRAARSPDEVRAAAGAVRADAPEAAQRVAEYAADAASFLDGGAFNTVLYVAANAAVVYDGSPGAAAVERGRQARWLAERLGL